MQVRVIAWSNRFCFDIFFILINLLLRQRFRQSRSLARASSSTSSARSCFLAPPCVCVGGICGFALDVDCALAAKPGASDAEHREAERLLSQAFEQDEDSALVPLIVLYLQYPQSWPEIDPQQRIDQWRARGLPQADLAQIILYRTQGTYARHLGEIEQVCQRWLRRMDVCWYELATVYQMQGYMLGALERYDDALIAFENALAIDYLPDTAMQRLRFNLTYSFSCYIKLFAYFFQSMISIHANTKTHPQHSFFSWCKSR